MNLKLKRIAPLQAGKMLACLYGLMSLIMVPMVFGFMTLASLLGRGHNGPPLPLMFGLGVGFVILIPVFYAGIGFVCGVITAAIYNLLAGWIGGIELDFEPAVPPAL